MLASEERTTWAGEPNSVGNHLSRGVTIKRILTIVIWALGIPLVFGWLLLLLTTVEMWTAGHALAAVRTTWIAHP